MAGAGIKKFTVGETLSDAEINTYLMDQTVPVFTNAAARDSAFGGAGEPALSEGRLCYLQSTKVVQYYNGVTWSDSGQFTVADDAITAAKLADSSSVDLDRKIRGGAITSAKLASNLTLTGTTVIAATGKVQQLIEKAIYSSAPLSSTVLAPTLLNVANGAIYYYTAESSGDFAINITATATGVVNLNALMSTQETLTIVVFAAQGTTAKRLTAIAVDTSATVIVRWFGGVPYPSGNAKTGTNPAVDAYTITVLKTGTNTFEVFASQSSFKD